MMKTLNKNDWFYEGFSLLEEGGCAKVTIDMLCRRLNVTKGSFYHHFKNIDGYIEELMKFWLEENTLAIIRQANQAETEEGKLKAVQLLVPPLRHKAEMNIRAWSFSNTVVNEYVRKADRIRLQYLADRQIQLGCDKDTAHDYALLEYATLIGLQHLVHDGVEFELSRLQQLYYGFMVLEDCHMYGY